MNILTLKFSDVNECLEALDDCHPNAQCVNTEGSFTCLCQAGFTGDGVLCFGEFSCDFFFKSFININYM